MLYNSPQTGNPLSLTHSIYHDAALWVQPHLEYPLEVSLNVSKPVPLRLVDKNTIDFNNLHQPVDWNAKPAMLRAESFGLKSSLFAGRVLNGIPTLKIHWGDAKEHAALSVLNSAVMMSTWWALFSYGGSSEISQFQYLVASMVPGTVIGGFIAGFMDETIRISILERYVRPWVSYGINTLGLQDLFPSFRSNQGLAEQVYELWEYRLNLMKYELTSYLNAEARRKLDEIAEIREWTPGEVQLSEQVDREIQATWELFEREKKHLEKIGVDAPNPFDDEPQTHRHRPVFTMNALVPTYFASTAATLGASVYLFGVPQWTENTKALMTFVGVSPLLGMLLGFFFYSLIYSNVWQFIVRPSMAWVNRKTRTHFFAGVADELGIPHIERSRAVFDRGVHMVNKLGNLLFAEKLRLEQGPQPLMEDDLAWIQVWDDALKRKDELVANIRDLMDGINADHDYN